jgi:hypothetical protein
MTRAVLLLVVALLCASLASTAAMQLFPMASHPEVDACVDAEADERRQIQHDHCDMGGVSTCGVDDPVDRGTRHRPMHWPDVANAVRLSVRDTARRARDGLGRAVARAKHATEKATERNTDEDRLCFQLRFFSRAHRSKFHLLECDTTVPALKEMDFLLPSRACTMPSYSARVG